jgi:hypothetical protein
MTRTAAIDLTSFPVIEIVMFPNKTKYGPATAVSRYQFLHTIPPEARTGKSRHEDCGHELEVSERPYFIAQTH